MTTRTPEPAEHPSPNRRMTLSQVLELLLQRGAVSGTGVSLTRNAKGETQIDVTVKVDGHAGITSADLAYEKAIELYDLARRRYPMASGFVGASEPAETPSTIGA